MEDTLDAGAGLCDPEGFERRSVQRRQPSPVRRVGRNSIRKAQTTREGGHSYRRVVHVADATGKAITQR